MSDPSAHNITDTVFSATEELTLKDAALFEALSGYIDQLIKNDFERLVSLLYRIDVNENKLRQLLKQHSNTDAGKIIAASIIERQIQKIESRLRSGREGKIINEDERW